MKSDRNGCSTCPIGGEQWEEFEAFWASRGDETRIQYDYRALDGALFGCIAKSLEEARAKRDEWLRLREGHVA